MNNFLEIKNHDVIKLSPKYLDDNLKEHIQRTLKNKYEGLCSKFGYIKTDSINILNIKEDICLDHKLLKAVPSSTVCSYTDLLH